VLTVDPSLDEFNSTWLNDIHLNSLCLCKRCTWSERESYCPL